MRFRPAVLYTWIASLGLGLQGTSTLAARLIPDVDRAIPGLLEHTQMIPAHSLLHIVSAAVGFAALAAGGDVWPTRFALWFGLFYAGLGFVGAASGQTFGLGLQPFDHPFHAVLGGAGVLAAAIDAVWSRRSPRGGAFMSEPGSPRVADLRISLPLRIWIGIEVVFGLMSIGTISLTPQNTAEHFAWPIQAHATAALLGGFYLAAASFFVLALFARRWENIRVFVPASILFSSTELAATLIHLDKFSVGTTPFNVWFVSYILPPPLFTAFYIWHQRRSPPIPKPTDEPLPSSLLLLMRVMGAAIVALAVLIFVLPATLVAVAPIAFTPLTARALSGWILATGLLLILAARENDRTRARLISPFFILALPAIAIEVARFSDQVDWSNPIVYAATLVLAVVCAIGVQLFRGDWRRTLG